MAGSFGAVASTPTFARNGRLNAALAIFPEFEARRITVAIEEFLDTLTRGANMMRAIGLLALLAVLNVGAASAQMEAPIGHRQPRASDVPNENSINNPNDPLNKENAALD